MSPNMYVTGLDTGDGLEFGHVAPALLDRLRKGMVSSSTSDREVGPPCVQIRCPSLQIRTS